MKNGAGIPSSIKCKPVPYLTMQPDWPEKGGDEHVAPLLNYIRPHAIGGGDLPEVTH